VSQTPDPPRRWVDFLPNFKKKNLNLKFEDYDMYTNMNRQTDKHDSQESLQCSVALSPLKPGRICLRQQP
jgi:hypothetical protein